MHRTANRGPPSPRPRSASAAGRSLRQPAASLYWSACGCPAAAGCPSPRSVSPRPTQLGSAADRDWRSAQTVRSGSSLMNSETTLVSTRIARARRVVARRPARASTFAADDLERLAQGHKAVSVPAGSSQRPGRDNHWPVMTFTPDRETRYPDPELLLTQVIPSCLLAQR